MGASSGVLIQPGEMTYAIQPYDTTTITLGLADRN